MKDALIKIQVLYELAISIGSSLDMKTMLQKSLSTYLRKFSCAAGAVLQGKVANDIVTLDVLFSIPRTIESNAVFQVAMAQIPMKVSVKDVDKYLNKMPYTGSHTNYYFHVMSLPGFGLLLLIKHGSPLDPYLIKSLLPLNAKLSTACRSCLRKSRLEAIAKDLKIENRERQKAEKALAGSHEQMENIFNSLAAVVYVADLETNKIIFTNHHMAELYGEKLEGRPCFEVIRGASQACPKCQGQKLIDANGTPTQTMVWEEYNPSLSRWFVHHARAIPWRQGRLVRLQISTDVTRLKQLEQERMEASHRQQAQRLESLGTLAGGIAHEFNNLLMGMMGCVSIMKFDMKESHPFHLNLDRIERNIREASGLTDKLLGYAQKGRYENSRIQINAVIRDLIKPLGKTHPSLKIELNLDEALHKVEVDRHQIAHALLNLFTNACDAMPDGGLLIICTSNAAPQDVGRRHDEMKAKAYIRVSVRDSGIGMTEETKERIFDPFYTTKRVGRGAGLGMAATYGIVKGHHGFIDVETTQGQGSNLVVYLPAIPDTQSFANIATPLEGAKKTILIVDDESIVLEIGQKMLTHLGHKVITAENGKAALAIFRQHHHAIDLIILDLILPDMTGEQTYDQLKTISSNVKVLISSGFSMDDQARTIMVKGADNFLQKPFSLEDLESKIDKAFSGLTDDNPNGSDV